MTEPCQPPDPNWRAPKTALPAGTCDCHVHIMGPFDKFALSERRGYTPEECSIETFRNMMEVVGIDRAVIVQGSAHGNDNRVTVDAVQKLGDQGRGIVLVPPDVSDAELEAFKNAGICGLRLSTISKAGYGPEHLTTMAERAKDLGWMVLLHFGNVDEVVGFTPLLETMPTDFVIDHQGRPLGKQGADCEGFEALLNLVRNTENCWVKLSSWYRQSQSGAPYDDMRPFVEALIEARPDRLIWGSNWPHPNYKGVMPNDADLLQQMINWSGSAAMARRILIDNPVRLFGFSA
ncbi:MAG: amidohydrolase family protein [Alphaproteobacteria bacterium]|jgi:2-pyrone-4,6-dicarboxylate lactonase